MIKVIVFHIINHPACLIACSVNACKVILTINILNLTDCMSRQALSTFLHEQEMFRC